MRFIPISVMRRDIMLILSERKQEKWVTGNENKEKKFLLNFLMQYMQKLSTSRNPNLLSLILLHLLGLDYTLLYSSS